MTDIKKIIEQVLPTLKHHNRWRKGEDVPQTDVKELTFALDSTIDILSKWQEATRWRKFGTDDLPQIGQQIVCKNSKGGLHLSKPISHGGIYWLAEHFTEWRPIEE